MALVVLVCALPASAQFWEKKPAEQWSKSECAQMLRDSPWAKSRTLVQVTIQQLGQNVGPVAPGPPGSQQSPVVEGRDANPQVTYLAQLWSARPIREALVRQSQLDPRYPELPAEERKALDERNARMLAAEFSDRVLVRVYYSASAQSNDVDLARYWQGRSPEELKRSVYLIGTVDKVNPTDVEIAKGSARILQFQFPRRVNDRPVVAPGDNRLALEFEQPEIGAIRAERVTIEFSVKKMTRNGAVVY